MGKFDQRGGGDRGGRGGFGGGFKPRGGFGGGRDRDARPEMFRATCAECGSSCEVPFKPSGDRPVLCSSCFSASKGEKPRESRERSFESKFDKGGFNDRPSFSTPKAPSADISKLENEIKAINEKLEKILQKLATPVAAVKTVVEPVAKAEVKTSSKPAVKAKAVAAKPAAKVVAPKAAAKKVVTKKPAVLAKKK
ncbi:MAG: CxxC-x17-CxxC domain-containing protein [Candidatus Falkowbacteria bacterium]